MIYDLPVLVFREVLFLENIINVSFLGFSATRRNALCMTFCWFAFCMGYFGLVYNTPTFDWNIYLVFVFPTFGLIPIVLLQPWVENKFGRKPMVTFALLIAGTQCWNLTIFPSLRFLQYTLQFSPIVLNFWPSNLNVHCTLQHRYD